MIRIEIKNPRELAKRESGALKAKILNKLAPDAVRKKVEEKVVEELKKSFSERGIEADISIRETED